MDKQSTEYIELLLARFNANPEDESLTPIEKQLLSLAKEYQNKIASYNVRIQEIDSNIKRIKEEANKDINSNQVESSELTNKILYLQGQSQGLIDALVALQKNYNE